MYLCWGRIDSSRWDKLKISTMTVYFGSSMDIFVPLPTLLSIEVVPL